MVDGARKLRPEGCDPDTELPAQQSPEQAHRATDGRSQGLPTQLADALGQRQFRKLLTVRLSSQTGDGLFQTGLATLFFFRPEQLASASQVALAFVVLLLPFTLVGPVVGPLLDRWRRRQVLVFANALRGLLTLTIAALLLAVGTNALIYVLALLALSLNRFLLAALSAALPHTLPTHFLVLANSVVPTMGGIATGIGAFLGFALAWLLPLGVIRDVGALTLATLLFALAAALATRFEPDALGPTVVVPPALESPALESPLLESPALGPTLPTQIDEFPAIRNPLRELWHAIKYLQLRRAPAHALYMMAVHRTIYGIFFISLLLIARNILAQPANPQAGLAAFGSLLAASFVGNALAIVLTPVAVRELAPGRWVVSCFAISGVGTALMCASPSALVLYPSAFLLGLGVQGAKISVDAIVQASTDDEYRGRAFALYDMLFNLAFVGSAAIASVVLPASGWHGGVFATLLLIQIVAAALYYFHDVRFGGPSSASGTRVALGRS